MPIVDALNHSGVEPVFAWKNYIEQQRQNCIYLLDMKQIKLGHVWEYISDLQYFLSFYDQMVY